MKNSSIVFSEIRNEDSIEGIIYLAKCAHLESRFSYIEFAPEKVHRIISGALADLSRNSIMMAEIGGRPVGAIYSSVGEYHIGKGKLMTTIHSFYVLRNVRRALGGGRVALGLLRGVETWSQARNSSEILFHVTSGLDMGRSHSFAKRIGYKFIGGSYAKKIG